MVGYYEFTDVCINGGCEHVRSAPKTPKVPIPNTPQGLVAVVLGIDSVQLSWTYNIDSTVGYSVYLDGELYQSVGVNTTTVYGLTPDTVYTFSVQAFDSVGTVSGLSSVSVITDSMPALPQPGNTITATLINTGTVSGGPESYLSTFGEKILFKNTPSSFVYSDDGGVSWTSMGSVPLYNTGFRVHKLEYSKSTGFWFLQTVLSTKDSRLYRSGDNGLSWTQLPSTNTPTYTSTSITIDLYDRVLLCGRGRIFRWDNPTVSTSVSKNYVWESSSHNVDNLKEIPGYGYAVSRWTGTIQNVTLIPYLMSSTTYINPSSLNKQDYIPWSYSYQGVIYAWNTEVSGNPRFNKIFQGMTTTASYLTVDFAEASSAYRIQAGDKYLLLVSKPTGVNNVWRLAYSLDGVNWIKEINLVLPNNPDVVDAGTSSMNLYHAYADKWIAYYISGGVLQLISFSFLGT